MHAFVGALLSCTQLKVHAIDGTLLFFTLMTGHLPASDEFSSY